MKIEKASLPKSPGQWHSQQAYQEKFYKMHIKNPDSKIAATMTIIIIKYLEYGNPI